MAEGSPRDAPAPPRLWWVYLLVYLASAALGAGVGYAVAGVYNVSGMAQGEACLNRLGVSVADLPTMGLRDAARITACLHETGVRVGVMMLAGAVALPLGAWVLTLLGALGTGLRLRRWPAAPAIGAVVDAAERFDRWCEHSALAGRHRPRVWFVAAQCPLSSAFTTRTALGLAVVVLPENHAYAQADQFDTVVLHELAHVRSRDVAWAASVWWIGWLIVPALLAAIAPLFTATSALAMQGRSLITALVLSAAVLLLRSALLRRRETAADRYAVAVLGDDEALRALMGVSAPDPDADRQHTRTRLWHAFAHLIRLIRDLTASHPPRAVRADAARTAAAADRWDGGFVFSAAAGLVAMMIYQSIIIRQTFVDNFGVGRGDVDALTALAAASLVWAAVVVPAWVRRASAARAAGEPVSWRAPFAGALCGLLGAYITPIPGVSLAADGPVYAHVSALGWLALAVAGVCVLAAAMAVRLADSAGDTPSPSPRVTARTVVAVIVVACALLTAWKAVEDLLLAHYLGSGVAATRMEFNALSPMAPMWYAVPTVFAGIVLTFVTTARQRGRYAAVVLVAAGVGGAGARLSALRSHAGSSGFNTLIWYQGRWICALAGWAAAVAITVVVTGTAVDAGRVSRVRMPAAVVPALASAVVTTSLAELLHVALAAFATPGAGSVLELLGTDLWLLFATSVLTLPWLLAADYVFTEVRAHRRRVIRPAFAAAGTGLLTAGFSLMLATGPLAQLTIAPGDFDALVASQARTNATGATRPTSAGAATHAATPPKSGSRSTVGDPGRLLSPAQAATALAALPLLLPPGATQVANGQADTTAALSPPACRDRLERDNAAKLATPHAADVIRTYTFPATGVASRARLVVELSSTTVPANGFAEIAAEIAACRDAQVADPAVDGGYFDASITAGRPPDLGHPAFQVLFAITGQAHSIPFGANQSEDLVLLGHNEIAATLWYDYDYTLPPEGVRQSLDQLQINVLNSVIDALPTGS